MAKKDKDEDDKPVEAVCNVKCFYDNSLVRPGQKRRFRSEADVPAHFAIIPNDVGKKIDDDKKTKEAKKAEEGKSGDNK